MMCFGSREDVEAKRSKEIDALIHRDEKVMQRQVKLLLLGKLSRPPQFISTTINQSYYFELHALDMKMAYTNYYGLQVLENLESQQFSNR